MRPCRAENSSAPGHDFIDDETDDVGDFPRRTQVLRQPRELLAADGVEPALVPADERATDERDETEREGDQQLVGVGRVSQRLAGGHASVGMGRVWTSLIIAEVAITVAILPWSVFMASESLKAMMTGPGFPAEEYLSAELSVNREQDEAGSAPDSIASTADSSSRAAGTTR